jgi:hypothetical protein
MGFDIKLLGSGVLKEGDDRYIDAWSERHARVPVVGHSEWYLDV